MNHHFMQRTFGFGIALVMTAITLALWSCNNGADAGPDGSGTRVECNGPNDCAALMPYGLQVYCCVNKTCVFGQAAASTSCDDPDADTIQASNYDLSCAADSDCIAVAVGDFCQPNAGCPNATISKAAQVQYQADVAKTYAGRSCIAESSCGSSGTPCCRQGTCQINGGCWSPTDTLPACADAGGTCSRVFSCGSLGPGPSDSCAYSDEACCLN